MKRNVFMDHMNRELQQIREKERILAEIKRRYSRYGERIVNIMVQYAKKDNGLKQLMKLLDLNIKEDKEEEQHSGIVNWLNTYGERRFLDLHRRKTGSGDVSFKIQPIINENSKQPLYQTGPASVPPPQSAPLPPPIEKIKASEPSESKKKTWPEVERRNGKDRRHKPDRRDNVELIFKNKRYGGERRGGKDRRKKRHP